MDPYMKAMKEMKLKMKKKSMGKASLMPVKKSTKKKVGLIK